MKVASAFPFQGIDRPLPPHNLRIWNKIVTGFSCGVLLFLFSNDCIGQNPSLVNKIDSLKIAYANSDKSAPDIITLERLCLYLAMDKHYDEAIKYATEGVRLTKNLNLPKKEMDFVNRLAAYSKSQGHINRCLEILHHGLILANKLNENTPIHEALYKIAKLHFENNRLDSTEYYYSKMLQLDQSRNDLSLVAVSYKLLAELSQKKGNYDDAMKYLQSELKSRKQIPDEKATAIADCYTQIGHIYFSWGRYTEAFDRYQHALNLCEPLHDTYGTYSAYNDMGNVYRVQSRLPEALNMYFKAMKIAENGNDPYGKAMVAGNIGITYKDLANYEDALKYHKISIETAEKFRFWDFAANGYNNLAIVNSLQNDHTEAVKNLQLSIELKKKQNDLPALGESYGNLGIEYIQLGKYPDASKYLGKALDIAQKSGDQLGVARTLLTLGSLNEKENHHKSARAYYLSALSISNTIDDKEGKLWAYGNLASLYKTMKNFRKAFTYSDMFSKLKDSTLNNETVRKIEQIRREYEVEKAVALEKAAKEKEALEMQANHALELSKQKAAQDVALAEEKSRHEKKILEENVRHEAALHLQKLRQQQLLVEEKLRGEKAVAEEKGRLQQIEADEKLRHERALHQEQLKYEQAVSLQKRKQDQLLAAKEKRNNMLSMGAGGILLFSTFFILFIRQRNEKKAVWARHRMTELELQSLRAQLNPHFMFNSLNAIQELIFKQDTDKSHIYLSRFSRLLRMLLENANQPFVQLKNELELLELYLSLEKLRLPDMEYVIQVDPAIDVEATLTPNMMLQPYIENAVWHGLSHKLTDRKLEISISKENHAILFQVTDNGIGRQKALALKQVLGNVHKSKGMELLSKRFSLLSQQYGAAIETEIIDLSDSGEITGTIVKIIVPDSVTEKAKYLYDTHHLN